MKLILLSPCTGCFSAVSVQARPEAGSLCCHQPEEAQYQLRRRETLLSARKNQNAEPTTARPLSDKQNIPQLECGPMPSGMAALLNIGGALCSTPH